MLNSEEVNVLGQIFNHTFGYSSDTMKVTSSLHGDNLVLKFVSVITFASEDSMQKQKPKYEKEATEAIADALKKMKSEFKLQTGRAIKVKEESRNDDIQMISVNAISPHRHAYYKMHVQLKVS